MNELFETTNVMKPKGGGESFQERPKPGLDTMHDPQLILGEEKKTMKEYLWDNWGKLNMDLY